MYVQFNKNQFMPLSYNLAWHLHSHGLFSLYKNLALVANLNWCQHQRVVAHRTCKAEVTQLDDSTFTEQNVLRLHVPVQNTSGMQIIQRRDELSCYWLNLNIQSIETFYTTYLKVKERIAVNGFPSHSYGTSLAIWDHTVLPATRHKWTHPTLIPASKLVLNLPTPEGWKTELT